jgi:hypothetical protein
MSIPTNKLFAKAPPPPLVKVPPFVEDVASVVLEIAILPAIKTDPTELLVLAVVFGKLRTPEDLVIEITFSTKFPRSLLLLKKKLLPVSDPDSELNLDDLH